MSHLKASIFIQKSVPIDITIHFGSFRTRLVSQLAKAQSILNFINESLKSAHNIPS